MTEGAYGSASEEFGDLSDDAREAFASVIDSLRGYNDVRDLYSQTQRLEFDRGLDAGVEDHCRDRCGAVGAGLRQTRIRFNSDGPQCEPMDWTNVYFVLAPRDSLPANVRIPKAFKLE
jgi:hypothetical protein